MMDGLGALTFCNNAFESLFGYRADEVVGQNVGLLLPSAPEGDAREPNTKRAKDFRTPANGSKVIARRKDGSVFPIHFTLREYVADGKKIFVGVLRDLTAGSTSSAQKWDSDRLLAQIVRSADVAILSKTLDGTITTWNPAAEKIFGYSAAEAVGQHVSMLIPPDRLAEEERIIATIIAGREVERYETVRLHKDGREIDIALTISPIRDGQGQVVGASKMVRDITDEKRNSYRLRDLQTELAHVTRLTTMGEMAAAIAHELNQPLAAVTNYINAAKHQLSKIDPGGGGVITTVRDHLQDAAVQALRAGGIIRNLRDFMEKRESEQAVEDINAVVSESVTLAFIVGADTDVFVEVDLGEDIPGIVIDKIQIQQVLVNLIRNAIEAMTGTADKRLVIRTSAMPSGEIEITVADSGPGLPEDVRDSVFKPFVTTKDKGMGMGLAICHSIIESHDGKIELVEDSSDAGAIFRIILPLSPIDEGEL